jgi:hypothetical protein
VLVSRNRLAGRTDVQASTVTETVNAGDQSSTVARVVRPLAAARLRPLEPVEKGEPRMKNGDVGSVRTLMQKLASLKDELSSDEQEAFSDMVQLAARSANELREEELRAAVGGAVRVIERAGGVSRLTEIGRANAGTFFDVGVLAKPQSSHPTLIADELLGLDREQAFPDVGVLAKPQSSHPTLVAEQLATLQDTFKKR